MSKYTQSNKNKFLSKNIANSVSIFKVEYEKILRRVQTNVEKLKNLREEFGKKSNDLNKTPNTNKMGKQRKRENVERVRSNIRLYESVIERDFDTLAEILSIHRLVKERSAKIEGAAKINSVNNLDSYYTRLNFN